MIDWNNAKIKYITTPITKSELADLLGCSRRTVMRRANDGGWDREKLLYDEGVTERNLADARRQADSFSMYLAEEGEKLLDQIDVILTSNLNLSPRDIKSLSSALTDLQNMRGVRLDESAADSRLTVEFVGGEW